jgi:hypothetical protein
MKTISLVKETGPLNGLSWPGTAKRTALGVLDF